MMSTPLIRTRRFFNSFDLIQMGVVMVHKIEDSKAIPAATLTALIHAASAFGYQVAQQIKDENAENAKALKMVLDADPNAEFIASVRLAPTKHVVLSVVTGGKQFIIYESGVIEVEGTRH